MIDPENLKKRKKARKSTVKSFYIVQNKSTGSFLSYVSNTKRCAAWDKWSSLKIFINSKNLDLSKYQPYKIAGLDREPVIVPCDWKKDIQSTRRQMPMNIEEKEDYELFLMLLENPFTYKVGLEADCAYVVSVADLKKEKKDENYESTLYLFHRNGNELLDEFFHFLGISSLIVENKEFNQGEESENE